MELEKVIETRILSTLQFSDRTSEINFNFITETDTNMKVKEQWEKLSIADEGDINVKCAVFESVLEIMKEQLTTDKLKTVGQILDFFEAFLKLMFMKYTRSPVCITIEVEIFNDFFTILPESWSSDPVKTHLLTKLIHETANEFNNSLYIMSKLVVIKKKLCCYVGLTLFWALYIPLHKSFFNETGSFQCQKYYKMHSVNKFFKFLPTNDQISNLSSDLMFKFLSLISIYVNYILLNDKKEDHGVFQEFFQCNKGDTDRFKSWLQNCRRRFDGSVPGGEGQVVEHHVDIFSLIELMDFNLMAEIENADSSEDLKI